MPGEFDFISWICAQSTGNPAVPIPPGDDLAGLVWPAGDILLVGVDQVLAGVHFDPSIHSPFDIGKKAMNRNLSDCAAMAALPVAALACVALPRTAGMAYAQELYRGLRAAADSFACQVVGGDTGTWDGPLALSVSIFGKSAGIDPITRSGAKAGDAIYVTGPLGGSILARHMHFSPRVELARQLAVAGHITAMIDLSDGLSRDLAHICKLSRVGAVLNAEQIPVHNDAVTLSNRDGKDSLQHALIDGEDYELLFTSPDDLTALGAIRIGTITREPGIVLQQAGQNKAMPAGGWEHSL